MISRTTTSGRRCTAFTVTAALVLSLAVVARLPAAARASAIRSVSVLEPAGRGDVVQLSRNERDSTAAAVVPAATVPAPSGAPAVRRKRTLLKLKPLIVLPAKVALGAGAKIVAGAKLGAKAVGLGTKALGASVVGLKAVKKVAKVTVKAATALGVKAVLLNFLFQKINQVIDFKTRLLSNLDQRNRQQNAQFLSPSKSVGNKDDDAFLASAPGDQQGLAQEQSKTSKSPPSPEDSEVTFDPNKVSLQVPDRLFGPSFTAVNGISQAFGTLIQNTAGRLAKLVDAIKASLWRKVAGVSTISNSSGSFVGKDGLNGEVADNVRGSRDAAKDDLNDDGLELDPLDKDATAAAAASKKRSVDSDVKNVSSK